MHSQYFQPALSGAVLCSVQVVWQRLLGATASQMRLCRAVPEGYRVLREGKAAILQKGNDVFYNPAQVHCLRQGC